MSAGTVALIVLLGIFAAACIACLIGWALGAADVETDDWGDSSW